MATTKDNKPEDEGTDQGIPEGFPAGWLDPTDQNAVAAYIEQHGIEAFQKLRNEQIGTTYE